MITININIVVNVHVCNSEMWNKSSAPVDLRGKVAKKVLLLTSYKVLLNEYLFKYKTQVLFNYLPGLPTVAGGPISGRPYKTTLDKGEWGTLSPATTAAAYLDRLRFSSLY